MSDYYQEYKYKLSKSKITKLINRKWILEWLDPNCSLTHWERKTTTADRIVSVNFCECQQQKFQLQSQLLLRFLLSLLSSPPASRRATQISVLPLVIDLFYLTLDRKKPVPKINYQRKMAKKSKKASDSLQPRMVPWAKMATVTEVTAGFFNPCL